MNNSIKISVIIPVFNTEKYLKKCIDSILNQTYSNIEIIIINDASTDNSFEILKNYQFLDNRINLINLEKNVGLGSVRNVGTLNSSGQYLTYIDSDDWVEKDFIEKHIKYLEDNKIDILCGGFKLVDEKENTLAIESVIEVICLNGIESLYYLFADSIIKAYTHSKFFKIELFKNFIFKENRLFEDTASTHLLFEKAEKILLVPTNEYKYLKREDSITGSSNLIKSLKAKKDFYLSLHERVEFCLENYKDEQNLLIETCNRAIHLGFTYIYFAYYHSLVETQSIREICKNLRNYPIKSSTMISTKTRLFYKLLLFNENLFLLLLKLYYSKK